jgi:hypothetical protein
MADRDNKELKRRATRAIISHAFFRLESALTIALIILLVAFVPAPWSWWRWWYWLVLGGAAELLIVITSITDERTSHAVVAGMLREQYDPGHIKTKTYREKLLQALRYREGIERIVSGMPASVLRDHLYDSTVGIADWIANIFGVASRLDSYERDEILQRDRQEVPAAVAQLQKALASARDAAVQQQIQATLAARKAQLDNLQALDNNMQKAQFGLEETLTALGTVYSQYQLINVHKLSTATARQLSASVHDQVERLEDVLTSMKQVYGRS